MKFVSPICIAGALAPQAAPATGQTRSEHEAPALCIRRRRCSPRSRAVSQSTRNLDQPAIRLRDRHT